ncbi:hypothetical protein [Clostridium tertium]|uniref:hypothetical protein n=1 Tax=Clostridium tertium TaxID=1559 RepID=UPI0024B38A91|nr:hypothetical protein [Clostridium tertium]MDI9215996.1 hypothetical protein [Clostridium tertium]
MLGERLNWNINIGNKRYVLKFNVKALKNIYKLTGISPFEFIDKFNGEDSDNKYLYQMLMAMSDLEITLKDLTSMVTEENKNEIKQLIILYLNKEFTSEFSNEENRNDDNDNVEEMDKLTAWLNWYNYYYYVMRYQLNMSEDEFESLTIREVKTLTDQHKMFNKNILLSAYIDVVKSKNENKIEDVEANNNIRIKDMFLNISR